MSYNPTSPLPGGSQTGFTSPTYTLTLDNAPERNGVQHAITAKGGTQPATVDVHSVSRPFTVTTMKPKVFKSLGRVNPVTGQLGSVPRNIWRITSRKGVTPLAGQASVNAVIRTIVEIPAGADTADPDNIRALLSLHAGVLWDQSNELGDAFNNGLL